MTPERWRQIEQVLQAALEREPAERATLLEQECADDPSLRDEVESLLASSQQADSFLGSNAFEDAAVLLEGADADGSMVGRHIGPYSIQTRLGAGGMREVYLAHDVRLGRKVALKLLDPALTGDSQSRTRFLREARLASALDHPNICTVHEVGEAEGRLFIAMQYVEGETLRQIIDGRPLKLDSLLSISLQVAAALAAAHEAGVIHRDIKPGNIIVTPRGQVKVFDFGLAKLLEKTEGEIETHLTVTGAVMGTPAAMSPEQARGERVDHRSDIFSFGVVMYEMATGLIPFKGRTRADVIGALLKEAHTPSAELNKDVPARLSAVIDRALRKEPAERYQSMREMMADLRQVVAEAGGLDHLFKSSDMPRGVVPFVPPRSRSPIRLFGRRVPKRAALAFLSVIALALVGLALAIYRSQPGQSPATQSESERSQPPTPIKSIAVLPFKPLIAEGRDESLELGMADTLIARLSNIREINVRPISAVRKYVELEQDAVVAGREQRVDAVLEGHIQKAGEKVRVTVRLVRVGDGSPLWAGQFDEKITDIFTIQDSISERVAAALAVRLIGEEKERLTKRHTENTDAYQLYLKGRYHLGKRTGEGFKKALEHFNQAIEKDPGYALAYSGLADTYILFNSYDVLPPAEAMPKARAAAVKALEMDDQLAEAHTSLASVLEGYYWDLSSSEREYKRAIELNPNYATAHQGYGEHLTVLGRFDEALAEMKRAQELDPLSLIISVLIGDVFYYAGQYDRAIEQYRKTLEMEPNFWRARGSLTLAFEQNSNSR